MRGARVEEVGKGSCAEKAGLQAGDIITKIQEKTITTANELINAKNAYKAGDQITLEVFRNSEKITLIVELDEYEP
jgi:S1-C subfamily serine protease